jgi:hypothetical protein
MFIELKPRTSEIDYFVEKNLDAIKRMIEAGNSIASISRFFNVPYHWIDRRSSTKYKKYFNINN